MCGIVGYIGQKQAIPFLLDGLSKLEYRGYDSSGVAYVEDGALNICKYKGGLSVLEEHLKDVKVDATIGIGHTRWATHGSPSDENAHPHADSKGRIALVHNGIFENYEEVKSRLIAEDGIVFKSETDSEVIAHLISKCYNGDILDAVFQAVEQMRGAYALGVICKDEPDRLIAVRKDSPLVVGLSRDGQYIASDIPALLKFTKDVYFIENGEVVELKAGSVKIFDENRNEVKREVFQVDWDVDAAEKQGFDHFTIKEIHEQPEALKQTLQRRLDANGRLHLEGIGISAEELSKITNIQMASCGTAYHACLIGKRILEKDLKIPVTVEIASEYRYNDPIVDEHTLFITVSQSGETIDTLQSLREAKKKGARVISVVNVVGSSIARESDDVFYTWAGPEIGVASTKAFTTQIMAMYMISTHFAMLRGRMDEAAYKKRIADLDSVSGLLEKALACEEAVKKIAKENFEKENVFFMGRGVDVDIAYEASLKFKELSYINSFGIASGELKHGPIALIEQSSLVLAFAGQSALLEKSFSNIMEVKARGAHVISVCKEGEDSLQKVSHEVIYLPEAEDYLMPFLSIVPAQFLAYYVAVFRGNNVDKPRNLAKSVTVE
ncbi:MAG: glutamine--fructose-6-phosphate transaminase (isomerizing) [Bacillota bacterium]|nr:glutamine--fructose-6-phosphate transaminase (isomerizing) [Bacillota bacterium]